MSQLYVNKELLIKLNNRAIRRNSNRTLKPKALDKLPNTLGEVGLEGEDANDLIRYPVTMAMPHNDVEMRCSFATHEGQQMWLDISFKEYEALPSVELNVNETM
tara:strand:+ start:34 stop:345 length:312 start_codon:yes stop_codon:yes gene_type:complete